MVYLLNNKRLLIGSMMATMVMFTVVMFLVNPLIDGKNGMEVIALQLSFDKEVGTQIIESLGSTGVETFNRWIFTDYLYALAYALFLASLLSSLIVKKGLASQLKYRGVIYLPFMAGVLDWIENTMELLFLNNPLEFSSKLFILHSVVASIKWIALPVIITYISLLLFKKKSAK